MLTEIHPIVAARELERKFSSGPGLSRVARYAATTGAAKRNGLEGWKPPSDAQMFEGSQRDMQDLQARGFDLHLNNPDIRGHNFGRTGRVIGSGVAFKCLPLPKEIGMTPDRTSALSAEIDRLRELHSDSGGFDAAGRMRSEGILQYVAFLTQFPFGSCLIHRVWSTDRNRMLPLSIELIPGSRISTPYNEMGSPLIHNGVQYADELRSRVAGWHVRRVPKTIGDSSVALPEWDFIPCRDGVILELAEPAGVDRSFPNAIACMRLVFNRGEMTELSVEAARAHATVHGVLKVAEGHNPQIRAEDLGPDGFRDVDGVKERLIYKDDEYTLQNAFLPGPDFPGFMDKTDSRLTRGLNTRGSEFTRQTDTSYSGGMQERQIDKPNVDVMRESFVDAWRVVHGWVLDAVALSGRLELPNYCAATKPYWLNARVRFPGEAPLNPVDHESAKNMRIANGTSSEIGECEAEGHDYAQIQRERAEAWKIRRAAENGVQIPPGTLDPKNDLPDVKESTMIDGDGDGKTNEKNRGRERVPGRRAVGMGRYEATAPHAASYFVGARLAGSKVDMGKRAIYGVAIATIGPVALNPELQADETTLKQIKDCAGSVPVRSRFNHPQGALLTNELKFSGDLKNLVGSFEFFRIEGDKVVADFYAVAPEAPGGEAATGLLHLAADPRMAQVFGASIMCLQSVEETKIRIHELSSVDFVDYPALNPNGIFSANKGDAMKVKIKRGDKGEFYIEHEGKKFEAEGEDRKGPLKPEKGEDGKYYVQCNGVRYEVEMPKEEKEEKPAANATDPAVEKDVKPAASAAGAKAYTAADLEAAKQEGVKEAANKAAKYEADFNGIMDQSAFEGAERDAFRKELGGKDLEVVRFCAQERVKARTKAVGSGAGAAKTDDDSAARFNAKGLAGEQLRLSWGCRSNDPKSDEFKNALAEYCAAGAKLEADNGKMDGTKLVRMSAD